MIYSCCDELRRSLLRGSALNGVDFLEVVDHDAPTPAERQRKLLVHFVNPLTAPLTEGQFRIEGGERVRDIGVKAVASQAADLVSVVEVDEPGDHSLYTLRVVTDPGNAAPPPGFDPMTSSVAFSFKVECPSDFDCRRDRVCPPEPAPQPAIDYLAKDYASFRRLMLDRMSALLPRWGERNAADLGIALVELLAYVGDYLSYQQDAVATEAYLDTARRRVSVRRHARLVDYYLHDGCNARVWVHLHATGDDVPVAEHMQVLTRVPGLPPRLDPGSAQHHEAVASGAVVFELLQGATLQEAHNEMPFYTWGDERCCLPRGAMRATLRGHYPRLAGGDVVMFEEVRGPRTGDPADADPAHRHAARLTKVRATDATNSPLTDLLTGLQITDIEWHAEDALPFPVCVSAVVDQQSVEVSVARGNIVLADHGRTVNEDLGPVPAPRLRAVPDPSADPCTAEPAGHLPSRFRPTLGEGPVTFGVTAQADLPADASLRGSPRAARPRVKLVDAEGTEWEPRLDLLMSGVHDPHFVVEVESNGMASLRFGFHPHGRRPEPDDVFAATYRVGNGRAGNVGAGSIHHFVASPVGIDAVSNPLPAAGGTDPETVEEARRAAPVAFRTQRRAVTEADYADVATRHPDVQRAAATFRWTGSWHTVFLTADLKGGLAVGPDFEEELLAHVEPFRTAGYDLEMNGPRFVSLEIEMDVCVKPEYFRSDVEEAMLEVLSSAVLPGGGRGLFHPDNFTFGQTVYLSPIYAAAQAVPGVESVRATTFRRQDVPDPKPLAEGKISLERLEIARLENDLNFPEHGVLRLNVRGGK